MASILIVDNEQNIRFLISVALSGEHTVLEANDGLEGFEMFKEHRPDIIITDLNMPNMNGRQLTQQVRAIDDRVKIIATSALFDFPEESESMLEAGANLCLSKPIAIATILKAIDQLLQSTIEQK